MNAQLSYGNPAIKNAHVCHDALKCIMTDVSNIYVLSSLYLFEY